MNTKMKLAGVLALVVGGVNVAMAESDPLVVAKRITGIDETGVERVLLEDRAGVVSRQSALAQVAMQVNARQVAHPGVYRNLRVELAGGAFETGTQGIASSRTVATDKRIVRLDGSLVVRKSGVSGNGLATIPHDGAKQSNNQRGQDRMG